MLDALILCLFAAHACYTPCYSPVICTYTILLRYAPLLFAFVFAAIDVAAAFSLMLSIRVAS